LPKSNPCGIERLCLERKYLFQVRRGVRYMLYLKSVSLESVIFFSVCVVSEVRREVHDIFLAVCAGFFFFVYF
jgi:hypothetical protein